VQNDVTHRIDQLIFLQSHTGEELCSQIPTNQTEEELQYEDMNFFKKRPEPSSVSVQNGRQQQETVNAQLKESEPKNSSTETADSPEDLYIQVKCEKIHGVREMLGLSLNPQVPQVDLVWKLLEEKSTKVY